jgi:hypothetical protein
VDFVDGLNKEKAFMNISERYNEITKIRNATTNLVTAIEALQTINVEWTYLDLGNVIQLGDFTGLHEGLTVADLSAVIGTTLGAIDSLLAAGHGTNLYKVRNRNAT